MAKTKANNTNIQLTRVVVQFICMVVIRLHPQHKNIFSLQKVSKMLQECLQKRQLPAMVRWWALGGRWEGVTESLRN